MANGPCTPRPGKSSSPTEIDAGVPGLVAPADRPASPHRGPGIALLHDYAPDAEDSDAAVARTVVHASREVSSRVRAEAVTAAARSDQRHVVHAKRGAGRRGAQDGLQVERQLALAPGEDDLGVHVVVRRAVGYLP